MAVKAHLTFIGWRKDCRRQVEHYGADAATGQCAFLDARGRCIEIAPCQVLGEPGFRHFSTLPGGRLSASVSHWRVYGGD